jgi:hypothetical protein
MKGLMGSWVFRNRYGQRRLCMLFLVVGNMQVARDDRSFLTWSRVRLCNNAYFPQYGGLESMKRWLLYFLDLYHPVTYAHCIFHLHLRVVLISSSGCSDNEIDVI